MSKELEMLLVKAESRITELDHEHKDFRAIEKSLKAQLLESQQLSAALQIEAASEPEQIDEIIAALANAQLNFKPVVKNRHNQHTKSNYADLAGVLDATRPALNEQGIALIFQTENTPKGEFNIMVAKLIHASGQKIEERVEIREVKQKTLKGWNGAPDIFEFTAQGLSMAMTYAKRISVSNLLGVAADEDDDGNAASGRNDDSHKNQPYQPKNNFKKAGKGATPPQEPKAEPKATPEQHKDFEALIAEIGAPAAQALFISKGWIKDGAEAKTLKDVHLLQTLQFKEQFKAAATAASEALKAV